MLLIFSSSSSLSHGVLRAGRDVSYRALRFVRGSVGGGSGWPGSGWPGSVGDFRLFFKITSLSENVLLCKSCFLDKMISRLKIRVYQNFFGCACFCLFRA